ncbi:MAG: hypothetical protein H0W84_10845 [Bacteroidetes bacterium]|nr:hypothetical protein [Bacteroidota bacterium]
MRVVILTDKSEADELKEAAEIITKLRYNTKEWEEHYGADRRSRKKYWEIKADLWIDAHVKQIG